MRSAARTGINNAVARAAGLLAIAIFGAMAIGVFSRDFERRLDAMDIPQSLRGTMVSQSIRLAAAEVPEGVDEATRKEIESAIREAFVRAFRFTVLAAGLLAALSAAGAFVLPTRDPARRRTTRERG